MAGGDRGERAAARVVRGGSRLRKWSHAGAGGARGDGRRGGPHARAGHTRAQGCRARVVVAAGRWGQGGGHAGLPGRARVIIRP